VDGEEITEEPTEAPKTQIIDLMEALKESREGQGLDRRRAQAPRSALERARRNQSQPRDERPPAP